MNFPKLEIACFNMESAFIAEKGGADRIELCDDMACGGITPSFDSFLEVKKKVSIPVFVMIRPRGGNFLYNEIELETMKNSILEFKNKAADGFVFGILMDDNSIDIKRNKELVDLAYPLPCSFHRAFDDVQDWKIALQHVIDCGFKTILTSGTAANAVEGMATLKQLVNAADEKIVIMPGGGVRSANIKEIKRQTQANYFHSSAILKGNTADLDEVIALKEKLN